MDIKEWISTGRPSPLAPNLNDLLSDSSIEKMTAILINQSLYPELRKLGIQDATLDKINTDLNGLVSTIAIPSIIGMTIEHADDVVRWAIHSSLGFVAMPKFIASQYPDYLLPVIIAKLGPLDPIATGNINPLDPVTLGNVGGLGPILSTPAARGLLAAASVSAGIRGGQLPLAVSMMKATTGAGGLQLSTTHLLRSQPKPVLETLDAIDREAIPLPVFIDDRAPWEKNPELFIFPVGFPRTKQDMVLVVQTTSLVDVFKTKTDIIANNLADGVRSRAPGWALPPSDSIDWANQDTRFGFLRSCDRIMFKAEQESRQLFADTLVSMAKEAGLFLAAAREYVPCHPQIFEDYWDGQLRQVVNSGYGFMDENLARQRLVVNDLKTQLSQLDFTQEQAAEAAKQAQRKQESTCDTVIDVAIVVGIAVTVIGVVLLAIVSGGKAHDPYPGGGSYGPVNPNHPDMPDPTRRPGE